MQLADRKLTYSPQGVLVNGQIYQNDQADLQVIDHTQVKTVYTGKPRQDFEISQAPASAVQVETPAFITAHQSLDRNGYLLKIFANGAPVYFNERKIDEAEVTLTVGDRMLVDGVLLELKVTQLAFTSIYHDFHLDPWQLVTEKFAAEYPVDFPQFRRSPRIRLKQPKDKIEIKSPKSKATQGHSNVLAMIVPPLGMVILSVLVSFMSSANPAWMIAMGGASVLTAGFSVSSYFADKKDIKAKNKQREESYRKYLVKQRSRIEQLQLKQRHVLEYMAPSAVKLAELVASYDSRIYERMMQNDDFLQIRLGRGDIQPSFEIQYRPTDEEDELSRQAKRVLVNPYRKLKDAPIVVSLTGQTLGLAGSYDILRQAVQSILWQIAVLHSYRDVEFITLIPETDYAIHWQNWRWLPHMKIESLNLRGIVHNAQTKDMVLNSFYQILTQRRQAQREAGNDKVVFSPQYVFTILDETWLSGHQLNEFLADDLSDLGVTVIWGKDSLNMLPETATTTVEYSSRESGRLLNRNNVYEDQLFRPDHLPENNQLAAAIEKLANLDHVETEKNTIPDSIDFLSMYGVKQTSELQIGKRWQKADTAKSLAVPLGVRGKNDLVYLNLHERAHGPHGLIAGTTGSGKSEIIQSYILSLAVNFAPEDVGFLPIDFKGGGMANLFKNLPHMLGSITNLDGAGSARALASIRAELQKRQKLFRDFNVNHINGYTKLYKQGKTITDPVEKKQYPAKPLPHLFLISDEFAELKANEPDFMTELVSTARIGRSLGVHLILATQKPSGVVDDQIWSNSHFKLALKVSDPTDSNEIIKTPDAATITQPGRAYLQVGNNEIYELFQSAWSGADYTPHKTNEKKVDERIWLVNDYGQQELLTADLSAGEDFKVTEDSNEQQSQLEAIVAQIKQYAVDTKAALPDKPWLPPLGTQITSPEIDHNKQWQKQRNMAVPIGLLDIPEEQSQKSLIFDLTKMAHTAIFGSSGFGKSILLQTLVMNLVRQNTPEQVQFNLLDFGTNGLLPLSKLPHTADIVRLNEEEKLSKMMKRIRQEIDERKNDFQLAGVANLTQYEAEKEHLPIIVNVLDGYDSVTDDENRDAIDGVLSKILREGAALGIYLVISANRSGVIRMSMMSSIETKIALYLVDESEVAEVIGRDKVIQQEIEGRAQIKLESTNAFQVYLPNKEVDPLPSLTALNKEIEGLNKNWQGAVPASLPIVPVEYEVEYFNQKVKKWQENNAIALGLQLSDTTPIGFKPIRQKYLLIAHTLDEQLVLQREMLFEQFNKLSDKTARKILVDFENEVTDRICFDQVVENETDQINAVKQLMANYVRAAQEDEKLVPTFMYIADLESFIGATNFLATDFKLVLNKASKSGLHLIIQSMESYVGNSYDPVTKIVRENAQIGIVGARITDTNLIDSLGSVYEPALHSNEAYFFTARGKKFTKVRIPGRRI